VWRNLHECTFALHDMHMHTYAKSYDMHMHTYAKSHDMHMQTYAKSHDNVHVDDHQQTLVNKFELQSNFDHRSDHLSNYKLYIF